MLVVAIMATILVSAAVVVDALATPSGADTLVSTDGITTLATIGTVTPGPYASGQSIAITGTANSTLSNANLVANGVPGQTTGDPTGAFYFEECTDPGGLVANLPTTSSGCEAATDDFTSVQKSSDGSFDDPSYTVYDLPDLATLGPPTMVGTCDVAPNTCVIGIFAENPGTTGFNYPHLFSAPFNIEVGDGLDLGDDPGDGTAPTAAPTSATNSTVAASPTTVTADGVNTSQVTVSLMDTGDHPVNAPKSVTLSQGTGHSTIEVKGAAGSTATTDSGGHAVFTVSDTTAESVTYTATDTTDSNLVVNDKATVAFAAPEVSVANSTITAGSASVPEGGSTTVTVTLKDQGATPQPIAGKVITLGEGSGSSTITPASTGSNTTNAQGQATFAVSDTSAETVTYTAEDASDALGLGSQVSVTFGSGMVSASQSTLSTTTPIVATVASSGPQPTGTVTVTLLNGGNPIANKTVTLRSSSNNAVITPGSQSTGSNGQASFSVSDPTAETVTFNAVDTTDDLLIAATTDVSFEIPAASSSESAMAVSPTSVPADGVTAASVTVTIKDQFGTPLAGKTVTVSGVVTGTPNPSLTSSVSVSATTTDGSGQITFGVEDTSAESITYSATDVTDNVEVNETASVAFRAGLPQAAQSSMQASPSSVPADGVTTSTITVTAEDHNANPVRGITITLSALNGSSVITPSTGAVTDAAGQATFVVTDESAESVTYSATDATDGIVLSGLNTTVTFSALGFSASHSTVSAASTALVGSPGTSVTVTLLASTGSPVPGKTVSLRVSSGTSAVVGNPSPATTGADGQVSFLVTDSVAESVILTATDTTDGSQLSAQPTVVFEVAQPRCTGPAASISGNGSSFAAPALENWADNVGQAPYCANVSYTPSSSGQGRYEFTNGTVDYAVSDTGYVDSSVGTTPPSFPFEFIPITGAGVAFMYNIPGLTQPLQLTSYTACLLLTGQITNWDDPALKQNGANTNLTLPNLPVLPITESDPAGTNFALESYCIDEQPAVWARYAQNMANLGAPPSGVPISATTPGSNWEAPGNGYDEQSTSAVASNVVNNAGAIGAVQENYAADSGFTGSNPSKAVAEVENASGDFTAPTSVNVASALAYATQLPDGTQELDFNGLGAHVYNPSTYSYLLTPTKGWSAAKGETMSEFVNYALTLGQQAATTFGYASLGLSLERYGIDQVLANVPGAVPPTAAEQQFYNCGDLTPAEVQAGETTPTCSPPAPTPPCYGATSTTNSNGTVSCTYTYTGLEQSFVVPVNDASIIATLVGASGSGGAAGASISGTVTVTPGSTLYIEVGGLPFNGGGTAYGGDGGGASDIQSQSMGTAVATGVNGANWASALASRLIVAGGGGGPGSAASSGQDNGYAATSGVGGAGGQSGQDGQSVTGATCQTNSYQCTPVTYQGGTGGAAGEGLSSSDGNGLGGSVADPGGYFDPPLTAYSLGGAGGGGYTGGGAGFSGNGGPSNAGGFSTFDEAGAGGGGGGSSFVGGEETVGSPAAVGSPAEVTITYVPGALPPAVTPEIAEVMVLPASGALLLGGWVLVIRRRRPKRAAR